MINSCSEDDVSRSDLTISSYNDENYPNNDSVTTNSETSLFYPQSEAAQRSESDDRSYFDYKHTDVRRYVPTIPETPMVLKRHMMKLRGDRMLSREEQELNQIKELKMQLAQKKLLAAKSRRMVLKSKNYEPAHSTKPLTDAVGFNFATDGRLKDPDSRNNVKEIDFVSALRKNEGFNFMPLGRTVPNPFVFHGKVKKEEQKCTEKVETLAEKCNKFVNKTPDRFHTKSEKELNFEKMMRKNVAEERLKRTVPITPKLMTRKRHREVHVMSQAEREEIELEEMKKNQFKANKLNKKVLTQVSYGIKKAERKEVTVPKAFDLEMEKRATLHSKKANETAITNDTLVEEEHHQFKAKPVPIKILQGPVGLKPRKEIPLTIPKSPSFSTLHATKKLSETLNETVSTNVPKVCPPPVNVAPFKPQLEHRKVEPMPFSFETRQKEMMEKKEEKIRQALEAERQAREFHARPLPLLDPVLPPKRVKPATVPEDFNLEIDKRAAIQHEKWQKKLEEERRLQKEAATFRARPATVLTAPPFVPEKQSEKSAMSSILSLNESVMHVPSNLEKRAEAWKENAKRMHEKQSLLEDIEEERQKRREEEEKEEIRRIRAEAVHKAQPVRNFKPVKVEQSGKPLTSPHSPNFSERLTNRYANKTQD